MSNKYVIQNCPAYQKELVIMDFKTGETKTTDKNYCINPFYPNTCQDCTDCKLKQIVELCEQYKKDYSTTNGVWLLANNITNLLDIQEVE